MLFWLKWYNDENRTFPIEAIFKHKQVLCMRRTMPFTFFKYLFFIPEIFKFLKYAN